MKKFIMLIALVCCMFCFSGCEVVDKIVSYNEDIKAKYEKQARDNVTAYLQEKYPDETFEILNIMIRKSGHNGIFESILPSGYSKIAYVKIVSESGEWHNVTTNTKESGESGKLSCKDDFQEKVVKEDIENAIKKLVNINYENILDCKISFSEFMFHAKYDGDISFFLREIKTEDENVDIYGSFVYDGELINFSSFTDAEKYFLYYIDTVLFVAMKENTSFPVNINASIRLGSSFKFLYPYAINIIDIHEYKEGIATVYKNYMSQMNEIMYSIPFEYYDTTNFYTEEVTDISQWSMAIKSNSGYEWVKYNEVEIITPKYFAEDKYIYYLSCDSLNIDISDNTYSYFLLTKSGTNRRAFLVKDTNYNKASFIDDYLYVGDMENNDEWCIVRVKNREK